MGSGDRKLITRAVHHSCNPASHAVSAVGCCKLQDELTQLPALAIALQHPALSSKPVIPCIMARSWRDAVQQCTAGIMHVSPKPAKTLAEVTSLAQWLPKYAGLVQSISLFGRFQGFTDEGAPEAVLPEAEAAQLVASGLQLAAAHRAPTPSTVLSNAAAAAAGAAAGAAAADVRAERLQAQLQSFSSNFLVGPGLLYALPAASLTHLDLRLYSSVPHKAAAPLANGGHAAALARLTNLRQLRLAVDTPKLLGVFSSMLPSVTQLSRLTHLQVINHCSQWSHIGADNSASQALRQLLQDPCRAWQQQLRVLQLSLADSAAIDLSGLSGLQQLQLDAFGLPGDTLTMQQGWVLPKQLQQLDIAGCCIASPAATGIPDMQQLQQLTLLVQFAEADGQQALLQLAQLPFLQQLTLKYASAAAVDATADVWRHLPALVSWDLFQHTDTMTEGLFTRTLQASSHLLRCKIYGCHAGHGTKG
jgi:hypothetical protein